MASFQDLESGRVVFSTQNQLARFGPYLAAAAEWETIRQEVGRHAPQAAWVAQTQLHDAPPWAAAVGLEIVTNEKGLSEELQSILEQITKNGG